MTTSGASTTRIDGGRIRQDLTAAATPQQLTAMAHALRALISCLVATGLLPADHVRARKAAIDIVTG